MPIGYDYRCRQCGEAWMLFSKRFVLGPTSWGETKFTCLNCQTFLRIAASVDLNSWSIWLQNHKQDVEKNATVSELANLIELRLKKCRRFTPVTLQFASVSCPTCSQVMSTIPFGEGLMKYPKCGDFSGEFEGGDEITLYL